MQSYVREGHYVRPRQPQFSTVIPADPVKLEEPRELGRGRLPSAAIGLIVHVAEHTLRHLGQAITTAKLVRRLCGNAGSAAPSR